MADKRITDVDFIDSLNSDESFFVNKNNSIKQINKGNIVFDIVNGGTGANNAAEALANLGASAAVHKHVASDITSGTLAISNGGTNAADAAEARANLGITPANIGAKVSGDIESIETGGTGSSDGATGLKNLFASGATIISSYQYGDTLPDAGIAGRIFFKKVSSNGTT